MTGAPFINRAEIAEEVTIGAGYRLAALASAAGRTTPGCRSTPPTVSAGSANIADTYSGRSRSPTASSTGPFIVPAPPSM